MSRYSISAPLRVVLDTNQFVDYPEMIYRMKLQAMIIESILHDDRPFTEQARNEVAARINHIIKIGSSLIVSIDHAVQS